MGTNSIRSPHLGKNGYYSIHIHDFGRLSLAALAREHRHVCVLQEMGAFAVGSGESVAVRGVVCVFAFVCVVFVFYCVCAASLFGGGGGVRFRVGAYVCVAFVFVCVVFVCVCECAASLFGGGWGERFSVCVCMYG